ncbi:MAG TPA: monooxygenase FAD-binding protein [Acetobacteraceae bacterium]|jgi:thioredoxin reductase|nr:monooxygenase FAD-binding protein [Acetobacteraceae bacterium]
MGTMTDIAIIGAGPYGLSLAAHLSAAGQNALVFGPPMETWRDHMPEGMVLKSEGFASDLWHPDGVFRLKDYCAERRLPYQDSGLPVPLNTFVDYGSAFQRRFVPNLDGRWVKDLDRDANGFALRLQDEAVVTAKRVVLATGINSFQYIPCELDGIAGPHLSHSIDHHRLNGFSGRKVLVIGGGASGVELSGLLSQVGAEVTVAVRSNRIPFCGPPAPRSLWDKIKAPETGLGTGWRSWACVMAPMVFYQMPQRFRHMVVRKHLGPAPGWTSRECVERNVRVVLGAKVAGASMHGDHAAVSFQLDGGDLRMIEAEHVIAATGFKADIGRLRFLAPSITDHMACVDGTPVLSRYFETSVPGLFTVGVLAANSFGPLLRFAYGAGFASRRLSDFLSRTRVRRPVPAESAMATA